MAFDESLAERIQHCLTGLENIDSRKMFGGIGFFLNGNMLVGVWKDSLFARIGPEGFEVALLEPHVTKFDITGKAMTGWVLVEPEGIEENDQLEGWIQKALQFVRTLPPKFG